MIETYPAQNSTYGKPLVFLIYHILTNEAPEKLSVSKIANKIIEMPRFKGEFPNEEMTNLKQRISDGCRQLKKAGMINFVEIPNEKRVMEKFYFVTL